MQQGNITSINWGAGNSIPVTVFIQNDNIFKLSGEQIGVTVQKYKEIEDGLIKCKNRLIELGEIKVPKTPDEIIKEQNEMLQRQNEALNQVLIKCNELQEKLKEVSYEQTNISKPFEISSPKCTRESSTGNIESLGDCRPLDDTDKRGCNKSIPKSKK